MELMPVKSRVEIGYLFIALIPALVFCLSNLIIQEYAEPLDVLPERVALFDVNKEGAARVAVLAAFMLFTGASLAALLFFFYTLRIFTWRNRALPLLAFLTMALSALIVSEISQNRANDYAGRSLACLAAAYDDHQSDSARAAELEELKAALSPRAQRDGVEVARIKYGRVLSGRPCVDTRFYRMQSLGWWQFVGVAFSFAGLVIGAICCLATLPRSILTVDAVPTGAGPELEHWEVQSGRLNIYLYLGALLLGTTLVFVNALMRWPGYALLDQGSYHEHTGALVAYYGVVFTVMLASFYVPVATALAAKLERLKPATQSQSKLPDAFRGPLQILKIVVGLFSPALAGALPGIIDLIG